MKVSQQFCNLLWKSGDETPIETAILNVLNPFQMKDTLFLASGDCSAS